MCHRLSTYRGALLQLVYTMHATRRTLAIGATQCMPRGARLQLVLHNACQAAQRQRGTWKGMLYFILPSITVKVSWLINK